MSLAWWFGMSRDPQREESPPLQDGEDVNKPGLYLLNGTGEGVPVLTEGGHGDTDLLREVLAEQGYELREVAEA